MLCFLSFILFRNECGVHEHRDDQYSVVVTLRLWEIVLIIFVKSDLVPYISNVQTSTLATGVGDVLGNKVCSCTLI